MKYKFYPNSLLAFDGMLEAVKNAKRSIYWESYIFLNDTASTHNFFGILAEKAQVGVSVKIVIDAFGSYTLDKESIQRLRDAGVDVLFFQKWFRRIHRKLLIVDDEIGFIGGVNIGLFYMKWLDLQIKLSGPIVKRLAKSFAKSYVLCGGNDSHMKKLAKSRIKEKTSEYRLLEQWPIQKIMPIYSAYKSRLRSAKKSITIVTPYFYPHGWLTRSLRKAANRGVIVTIIMPLRAENSILTFLNLFFADAQMRKGINFLFTKEMIHAKVLLIDDREALVGSQNVDAQSLDHNMEAGILFERKDMVGDLSKIIEDWKKESVPFLQTGFKKKWYHYLLSPIIWIIQPIL